MKRYFVLPISSGHKSGGLFVIYEYLELLGINIRDNKSVNFNLFPNLKVKKNNNEKII